MAYTLHGEDVPGEGRFFTRRAYLEKNCKLMERKESIWCQYRVNESKKWARPPFMALSSFHAPLCQQVFGSGKKSYVDLMLISDDAWHVYQFHEASHYTNFGGHDKFCKYFDGDRIHYNSATRKADKFNRAYAKYLTEHTHLNISYHIESECVYHHRNLASKAQNNDDFVTAPEWIDETQSEEKIIKLALKEYGEPGPRLDGFLLLRGGVETVSDPTSKTTGMLLCRSAPSPDELGPTAFEMLREQLVARS